MTLLTLAMLLCACSGIGSTQIPESNLPDKDSEPPIATPPPVLTPPPNAWRSTLYPENWTPGFKDSQGRFIADFSYAGYYSGVRSIPNQILGPVKNVTLAPYFADNSGQQDATQSLQQAIDDVAAAGGGTVFLPAGTYKVKPKSGYGYALLINSSNIVFKGAGQNVTFIYNDENSMREKDVIRVSPDQTTKYSWHWLSGPTVDITQDLLTATKTIPVSDVSAFTVGEWVMVSAQATADFIEDHGMTGKWTTDGLGNILFYRQITSVDANAKFLTIDSPTKYYLLRRDRARVYKVRTPLHDIGIEDLSIGMKQVRTADLNDNDYNKPNTASYQVHQSHALVINHTVNSWVRRVGTYKPSSNTDDVHVLSNGLHLFMSKNITVEKCDFRKAQYLGAGGNGYLFINQGQDNLIIESYAEDGRHNYDFTGLETSGNVILKSKSVRGRLPSDFHMYLSPTNLIDSMILDGDYIQSIYRDTATPKHGHSTTQSVFWNTVGVNAKNIVKYNFVIETQQFGWGYIIGTSGKTNQVKILSGNGSDPLDFVEGVGTGDKLYPASLYLDQLTRRLTQ